jgi:hypothetical protein
MTTTPDQPTELELLRRLMTKSRSTPVECELVVGGLPPALADEVPLPSGARLVGSMVIGYQGLLADLQVVLDATGNPTEVVDAFERELRERGWGPFEGQPGLMHGGFLPGPIGEARMLQRGGQGPVLRVSAWAVDGALTDLRLWLDWQMPRQFEDRSRHHLMGMAGPTRMPRLHPPEGVALETQGSSGGGGRWNSEARVDTDLTVAELEAHFASQLVEAGWTRISGRADDVVGWSSWNLPGEDEWRGLLLVLAAFRANERSLTLRIEETKPADAGLRGEGFSFRTISSQR